MLLPGSLAGLFWETAVLDWETSLYLCLLVLLPIPELVWKWISAVFTLYNFWGWRKVSFRNFLTLFILHCLLAVLTIFLQNGMFWSEWSCYTARDRKVHHESRPNEHQMANLFPNTNMKVKVVANDEIGQSFVLKMSLVKTNLKSGEKVQKVWMATAHPSIVLQGIFD